MTAGAESLIYAGGHLISSDGRYEGTAGAIVRHRPSGHLYVLSSRSLAPGGGEITFRLDSGGTVALRQEALASRERRGDQLAGDLIAAYRIPSNAPVSSAVRGVARPLVADLHDAIGCALHVPSGTNAPGRLHAFAVTFRSETREGGSGGLITGAYEIVGTGPDPFGQAGDGGAAVYTDAGGLLGLVVGGSDERAFVAPIDELVNLFDFELLTEEIAQAFNSQAFGVPVADSNEGTIRSAEDTYARRPVLIQAVIEKFTPIPREMLDGVDALEKQFRAEPMLSGLQREAEPYLADWLIGGLRRRHLVPDRGAPTDAFAPLILSNQSRPHRELVSALAALDRAYPQWAALGALERLRVDVGLTDIERAEIWWFVQAVMQIGIGVDEDLAQQIYVETQPYTRPHSSASILEVFAAVEALLTLINPDDRVIQIAQAYVGQSPRLARFFRARFILHKTSEAVPWPQNALRRYARLAEDIMLGSPNTVRTFLLIFAHQRGLLHILGDLDQPARYAAERRAFREMLAPGEDSEARLHMVAARNRAAGLAAIRDYLGEPTP